jgi:hypothetical protein
MFEETRKAVKALLLKSEAFRALPPAQQLEIANNTVKVAEYLAAPEGIPANKLAALQTASHAKEDPYAFGLAETTRTRSRNTDEEGKFTAQAAREGAAVAGALLREVNFPAFVSGLIDGVFHSIVDSSIKQMEAYGKLVADVAKSLNQFRDENVSVNQGRDYLAEQFPETFLIDVDTGAEGGPGPRVRLRDGVDESAALNKVNSLPIDGGPLKSLDLEDEEVEQKVVQAARTQLATSRQQLLATMVLMGINRIIVTDGRISAKVLYDFQARDNFRYQKSATRFDYDPELKRRVSEGEYESDYQGGESSSSYDKESGYSGSRRDASYYSKGIYKTTEEPVLTLASATQQTTDATLSTKASLAGQVEVNFKSETFPLEKMADSFQIGQIQNAAKPKSAAPTPPPASTPAPAAKP